MDLNSEKNLEMAEVLLSALNPAARATLWLKVVKSQKKISFLSKIQNRISEKTGKKILLLYDKNFKVVVFPSNL